MTAENVTERLNSVRELLNQLGEGVFELANTHPDVFDDPQLKKEVEDFREAYQEAKTRLEHPKLSIATLGTTSSGKSTIVNALIGRRIAPIERSEMSGGILKLGDSDTVQLLIEDTENAQWETGEWTDLKDTELYHRIQKLVEDSRQKQQELHDAITDLHKAFLIQKIADLQAELETLKRFPNDSPKAALKTATSVRLFLASQAMQAPLKDDANTLMLVDVSTQGWAVATATEANLLLQHGYIQDAQEMLHLEVPRFQEHANHWANTLLNTERSELATAHRFATPYFQKEITSERVQRIINISPSDHNLSAEKADQKRLDAEVELQMSRTRPQITEQWKHRQLALAEYLDTLSELSARLDGLLSFAQLCEQEGVKNSHDLLPNHQAKAGIYLLKEGNHHL